MPPAPPNRERQMPTKKSLRIWVRNNGHVIRSKKRFTYRYPRTVEAAQDPFVCASGKNKMFFLIAINVFPDSKIIRPDNSDSDTDEEEETVQREQESPPPPPPPQPKADSPTQKKMTKTRTKNLKLEAEADKNESNQETVKSLKPHNPEIKTDSSSDKKNVKSLTRKPSRTKKRPICTLKKTKTGSKTTNNENRTRTECSRLSPPNPSLSKAKQNQADRKKGESKDNSITAPARNQFALPSIVNNFQKVIQACSETGKVSFSLAKKPRQARS